MSAHHLSLAEAAAEIRPTDTLGIPLGPGQPTGFLTELGARESFDDLTIFGAMLVDLYQLIGRPGVHYRSGFFSLAERFFRDRGADVQFVPADFRRFAPILEQLAPRVMATVATPPDERGYMSLSLHAGASVDALHRAGAHPERVLLVETNAAFPRTFGIPPDHRNAIHVDEADIIVEGTKPPIELPDADTTDVTRAIAEHACRYVVDGSTLQTGFGDIPSAIARLLAEQPGGNYGVHSEMFTTGLMHLHEAGKVTNDRKGIYEGMSIATFAAGTRELYDWLDGNDAVRFLPVELVNAPEVIARNSRMVTINGAMAIDLHGQAVADTIGGAQYSGIGGHEDFIAASGFELEDRSIVCLPSTLTVGEVTTSRIEAAFAAGTVVTTPRHQLDVVVTEFGAAELRGRTVRQRAEALAAIAHPDFRDELVAASAMR